jgi:4-hydroxybenzoyl-CoA reductase subunit beta
MMRLPWFDYRAPRSVAEASKILAGEGPAAMLIAGGTDLLPNMKRRHQTPKVLVSLKQIEVLKSVSNGSGIALGSGLTLSEVLKLEKIPTALRQAAAQIATVHLRNMGTLGGNLCLDTRCTYYNQNYEWRKAIDFCLKKDGGTCWVATSSRKCLAVSSTDTAPALLALGAQVTLVSADATRRIEATDLYQNDGLEYLTRKPTEVLTAIHVPRLDGWRSTYWKLRRRGAFDFPVLSVAAAARIHADGTVESARLVLGAVASRPVAPADAGAALVGRRLTDEQIALASDLAARPARPMDNTDFGLVWRKRMARALVTYALRELRGDDMRECRRRVARQLLV